MNCCCGEDDGKLVEVVAEATVAAAVGVATDVEEETADGRAEEVEPRLRDRMAWKKPLLVLSTELVRELADRPATSFWDLDLLIATAAAEVGTLWAPMLAEEAEGEIGERGETGEADWTGVKASENADGDLDCCGAWCRLRRRISIVGGDEMCGGRSTDEDGGPRQGRQGSGGWWVARAFCIGAYLVRECHLA